MIMIILMSKIIMIMIMMMNTDYQNYDQAGPEQRLTTS